MILYNCQLISINISALSNKFMLEISDINIEQTIFGGNSPDLWHLSFSVVQMSGYRPAISKCGLGKRGTGCLPSCLRWLQHSSHWLGTFRSWRFDAYILIYFSAFIIKEYKGIDTNSYVLQLSNLLPQNSLWFSWILTSYIS